MNSVGVLPTICSLDAVNLAWFHHALRLVEGNSIGLRSPCFVNSRPGEFGFGPDSLPLQVPDEVTSVWFYHLRSESGLVLPCFGIS